MTKTGKSLFGGLLVLILVGCASTPTATVEQPATTEPVMTETAVPTMEETAVQTEEATSGFPWWNDVVFYQIFVRSFYDSDGDGIGDFLGIVEKLDYLERLGIGGIWLMPIHPSPSYHGYDVLDYYAVNPDYGTMEDFQLLLDEAHQRGIRIIMDFVINHTSNQHPWFQAALDPESDYHDWYVWNTESPQYTGPWGQGVWHRASNGLYYYGIFWGGMPDLNYDNPDVQAEILNISHYWLTDVGVDGFRVDGARYLFANGAAQADQPETIRFFEAWRKAYKAENPEAFVVGEVWTSLRESSVYDPDTGMDTLFAFDLADGIISGVQGRNQWLITQAYQMTMDVFDELQFSAFLTNHDMDRVMWRLGDDEVRMRLAAFVYLTGPGVPFIYYGEEIGMLGYKPDEQIRTPMQWSGEGNAGFTTGVPWIAPQDDYAQKNVAQQDQAPDSLLNLYRNLIQLRNENPALRIGDYIPVETSARDIYAVLRSSEGQNILLIANLGSNSTGEFSLSLDEGPLSGNYLPEAVLGSGAFEPLSANAMGGFVDYAPLDSLDGGAIVILVLE